MGGLAKYSVPNNNGRFSENPTKAVHLRMPNIAIQMTFLSRERNKLHNQKILQVISNIINRDTSNKLHNQ